MTDYAAHQAAKRMDPVRQTAATGHRRQAAKISWSSKSHWYGRVSVPFRTQDPIVFVPNCRWQPMRDLQCGGVRTDFAPHFELNLDITVIGADTDIGEVDAG